MTPGLIWLIIGLPWSGAPAVWCRYRDLARGACWVYGNRRRPANQPPVAELLDADQEYCQKARANQLPWMAPRRFSPTGEAWLPSLHKQRGEVYYIALFSNKAHAHELNMIHVWFVICHDDQDGDGQ